jgi:aspartyl aminopeptidase
MSEEIRLAQDLIDFIYESPSAFHVIDNAKNILNENGFVEIKEEDKWKLESNKKYYVLRNNSALIAFVTGSGDVAENGYRIVTAHSDSPCFRIKPSPEILQDKKYLKLNTEVYGAPILYGWMDSPLSLAGRVLVKGSNIFSPKTLLINIKRPIMTIPNVAIHLNKDIVLNKQTDMLPLIGMIENELEKNDVLIKTIANELNINPNDILDFDLFLYETVKGDILGLNYEFISSGRLDDLEAVHAGVLAITKSTTNNSTNVFVCFDNEEVGNNTKQGAESNFLENTLERITISLGCKREDYFRALSKSFMVSCDAAHGLHPNRPELNDPTNRAILNDGIVIKISGNQRYASDGDSIAVFEIICKEAGIPVQKFVNHSEQKGGTTIGPTASAISGIRTIDVGPAMLAMHSIRELSGVLDYTYLIKSFIEFYNV